MKIDVVNGEHSTVIMDISVEEEKIRESYEKIVKDSVKFITVPGFRKGKAPRKLAEKELNLEMVKQHMIEDLVSKTMQEAITEKNIKAVASPEIEILNFDIEGKLDYKAIVDIFPEIEISGYNDFEFEVEKDEFDEKTVEKALGNLQDQYSTYEEVTEERAIELGDYALADFEGFADGQKVDRASAVGSRMEMKEDSFVPGFVANIVGLKKGDEKEFSVVFPEDYPGELQGKEVTFKVKLNGIEKKVLPELNDDFAKKASSFENFEDLKVDLEKRIKDNIEARAEAQAQSKLCDKLSSLVTASLPESMIAREQQSALDRMSRMYSQYGVDIFKGLSDEQILKFAEDKRPEAEDKVRLFLALDKIADNENIEVTDSDVDVKIREIAGELGQDFNKVKSNLKKNRRLDSIRELIRQDKALKYVLSISSVKYVKPVPKTENELTEAVV